MVAILSHRRPAFPYGETLISAWSQLTIRQPESEGNRYLRPSRRQGNSPVRPVAGPYLARKTSHKPPQPALPGGLPW